MARPLRTDWFAWFTSLPSSTALAVCLFLPQFKDCNGREKSAFDTSTAPMMIALAIVGVLPLLWWLLPKIMGAHEELAGFVGALLTIAFIAFFPLVGVFSTWHDGAYLTWSAAWLELGGMVAWTSAATTRKELRSATRARAVIRSAPLDRSA